MMDQYHILEVIGEGSFGRVYKGRRKFSGQVVALKFIPKVGRSEKDLRSLKREIDIMRGLKHPNIVLLLDSFETEKEVVVVTEYAEGELFQILEDDGNLPESQVREIACQLVSALYYLHSHRILHRDMKPQNILLGKGGVVKLCDFGFARAMSVSTLVLTSIKGTPLYMSPELVEEKPYDHSTDLWSLGCILYELHTGAPPFYTNSIFHLVKLIVRDPVKWPENMSQDCTSFLKGLLMKDPKKRLSWPDLLHHPFVADGVLMVSVEGSSNPLTIPPSPDVQALKQQQAAEKKTAHSGEGKLLRKARELREKERNNRLIGSGNAACTSQPHCKTASAVGAPNTGHSLGSTFSVYQNSSQPATNQHQANDNSVTRVFSAPCKGQISKDYAREFPSVEVGPRQVLKRSGHARTSLASVRMDSEEQDVDSDYEWQQLVEFADQIPVNSAILQKLKTKLLSAKNQLLVRKGEEASSVLQLLKVLQNIVQSCQPGDIEKVGKELELPHLLFSLTEDILNIPDLMQEEQGEIVLGDLMSMLILYLEKSPDWEIKGRAEDLCQLFISVFLCRDPKHSALLATAVLTLFTHRSISVNISLERLTTFLGNILKDTEEAHNPLPAGWGMYDGLLSLILYRLSEDSELWPSLWTKVNTTLENTTSERCHFSPNGLYVFLSLALLVFSSDTYNFVALLSDLSTNCSSALSHLLTTSCSTALLESGLFWGDSEINSLSMMSCQLLCIPFSLDLPLEKIVSILHSYQSSNIVAGLVQMIQTLPVALVELPLCLLNRLLLSDPQYTASCLINAAQASAFLPYGTESSDNRTDQTQNHLNHFGHSLEQIRSNGTTKKHKIDQIKGDQSKKRVDLKGNVDTSKNKKDLLKAQHQLSKNKTDKLREIREQPKSKRYQQQSMKHFRERLEQQSGCIEELMDSLELCGSSAGHLQVLSAQQGCSISWLMDSLDELRRSNEYHRRNGGHSKVSTAKLASPQVEGRTANSLLAVLLQSEILFGCAVELLMLLSQLTRYLTRQSCCFPPVEATQLRLALHHQDDGIRAACCSLLGHLGSGVRQVITESKSDPSWSFDPQIFQDLLSCLCDPAPSVRRMACKAVGNWLSLFGKTDLNVSSKGLQRFKTTESERGDINALSVQGKLKRIPGTEGIKQGLQGDSSSASKGKNGYSEGDIWMEVAIEAVAPLVSLLSDADNVIRQHCCGALGNLAAISGGDRALLGADTPCLLLQTACDDCHHAVRRAAMATLCVFSQHNSLLQALRSLDAGRKLCHTSQSFLFQRDYKWLVSKLDGSVEGKT
ncbi:serine/threonine-protein kinase 36-like isoform X2 [Myxocyprinus asiaticus]|uniref:serine/threonine-protein kinase 36-like isoform X2 n=1 Tax=Myxocyprinus asiaticus TaxID=70543 RepID=UPI00222369D8|nr:serine/threonine-protein kinase 36-like isoform X2 [Myxocyprinus asiaticus]